jgi:hypothetical protein
LTIVNSAAEHVGVEVSLLYVFIPSNICQEVVQQNPNLTSIFTFLRNNHFDFHNDCSNLHSHQQLIRIPFPHALTSICFLPENEWNWRSSC